MKTKEKKILKEFSDILGLTTTEQKTMIEKAHLQIRNHREKILGINKDDKPNTLKEYYKKKEKGFSKEQINELKQILIDRMDEEDEEATPLSEFEKMLR